MGSTPIPRQNKNVWLPSLWLQHTKQDRRGWDLFKSLYECSLKQGENAVSTARDDRTVKSREPSHYLPLTSTLCGPPDVQHNPPNLSMRKLQCLPKRWRVLVHIPSGMKGKPLSCSPPSQVGRVQDVDLPFQLSRAPNSRKGQIWVPDLVP